MPDAPDWQELRDQIIGLGGASARKSYYPELQRRLSQLESARSQLQESEDYLRAILDTASEAIFVQDPLTGEILDVNQGMCRLYGWTREEACRLSVADLSSNEPPHTLEQSLAWLHRTLVEGPQRFEWVARARDGRSFWVEVGTSAVTLRERQCVVVTVTDVDERKRAEEDLIQIARAVSAITGDRFFDTLVEHLTTVLGVDGALIAEWRGPDSGLPQGRAAWLDGEALAGAGLALEGPAVAEVLSWGKLVQPRGALDRFAGDPVVARFDADGLAATLLRSTDGQPLGLIAVFSRQPLRHVPRVVTTLRIFASRAAAEFQRQRADEERRSLHDQLQQAQKLESIGRLAGGVAHDFNNMLSVIVGHLEYALELIPDGSGLRSDLEEALGAANRSAELTRQLLAFARRQAIAPQVLDLNQAVDGMQRLLSRLIGDHILLDWRPGRLSHAVRLDPSQLNQLLTNLVVNARDAMPQGGRLTVSTDEFAADRAWCAEHPGATPGAYAVLTVADTGRGIADAVMPHLFEPFYTTKRAGEGTGLGLATVYGIVRQNGGLITVASQVNEGSTFCVMLPCHEGGAGSHADPSDGDAQSTGGHETILLVEDEPAILRLAERILVGLGYQVHTASGPGAAMAVAEQLGGEIDLLLTDLMMPGMNGRDLARSLVGQYPHLRCLFMSGYAADAAGPSGEFGDGAFLAKPFNRAGLAAAVSDALHASTPDAPTHPVPGTTAR